MYGNLGSESGQNIMQYEKTSGMHWFTFGQTWNIPCTHCAISSAPKRFLFLSTDLKHWIARYPGLWEKEISGSRIFKSMLSNAAFITFDHNLPKFWGGRPKLALDLILRKQLVELKMCPYSFTALNSWSCFSLTARRWGNNVITRLKHI